MSLPFSLRYHNEEPDKGLVASLARAANELATTPPVQAQAIFHSCTRTDDLAEIHRIAEDWRAQFGQLINIGCGGSGLSGKALSMLNCHIHDTTASPRLRTLDTLDAQALEALMQHPSFRESCFLIVSKSGNTVETLAQAQLILAALEKHFSHAQIAKRVLCITLEGDNQLRRCAAHYGIPVLTHPPELGGRFSILSAVGLIPALFLGLQIEALRQGAAATLQAALTPESDAQQGAAWGVKQLRDGRNIHLLMPYGERLNGAALWWRQSMAESLGKDGQGSTPMIALGTRDQHSQLQLWLDGPRDKHFTLLLPDWRGSGQPLAGYTLGDLLAAQQQGTFESLVHAGLPVRVITPARIDEETLGGLIMHFAMEILFSAALMRVNPFDQPAVEDSKRYARNYLASLET